MYYEQGDTVKLFNGMRVVIVEMDEVGAKVADAENSSMRFWVEHSDIGQLSEPVLLTAIRGAA